MELQIGLKRSSRMRGKRKKCFDFRSHITDQLFSEEGTHNLRQLCIQIFTQPGKNSFVFHKACDLNVELILQSKFLDGVPHILLSVVCLVWLTGKVKKKGRPIWFCIHRNASEFRVLSTEITLTRNHCLMRITISVWGRIAKTKGLCT